MKQRIETSPKQNTLILHPLNEGSTAVKHFSRSFINILRMLNFHQYHTKKIKLSSVSYQTKMCFIKSKIFPTLSFYCIAVQDKEAGI